MKTKSLQYCWQVTAAVLLVLLATCPHSEARTQGKVVKPPRGAPPPQLRTLTLPSAYAGKGVASGGVHRGLAAGKPVAPSAPWTVVRESTHQTPIFVQFNQSQGAAAKPAAVASDVQVLQFITKNAALFRLRDPSSELIHRATTKDRMGREHVQLEQRYQGVPVWGASIVGHWSPEQGLYAINGRYQPSPDYITEVEPSIAPELAIDLAVGDLELHRAIEPLRPRVRDLLNYRGPRAELYLWSARLEELVRLTWVVEIRPNLHERWRYFVEARTGEILDRYQASPSDGPAVGSGVDLHGNTVDLHTYEYEGLFFLIDVSREGFDPETWEGTLETLDADFMDIDADKYYVVSSDNVFTDPVAVSSHANMARTYEYFLENHGRAGIVGDGSTVFSLIHVTENGQPMDNAYWSNPIMAYGDGGDAFSPFAGALDIAAHEMTHGIIEHTVALEYRYQSGALNESFADIFGAMVDDDDWQLGEDIVNKAHYPSGAMRDLRDPHNGDEPGGHGWQPAHMDEYQELDLEEDYGGVHVNSGIPNRAAYLVAEAIGRAKTAQIYYRILEARYLAPRSQFIDCRLAAEAAARDLFGDGSPEVAAVSSAYDAVGITVEETPEGPLVDVAADPGEQWVAIVAAELDGDNSPWLVKPTSDPLEGRDGWEHIFRLTTTQVFAGTGRAISAPVNGEYLVFVDSDNNLRSINADGRGEEIISEDGDWYSIGLSPDGRRLVATTTYDEPHIWYFDSESENWHQIQLYQPTTQDGIHQDIARYADVLQWDATGTYVIYDVFNSLPGPSGEAIDFWTVNVLEPASETIWPLFPPQPEGVQISSPALSSKIRPDGTIDDCRLLYERVDNLNERTEISVIDFCTGEEGVLYTVPEPIFTFPGFINGDREILFQGEGREDDVETVHLFRQPLTVDGLSSREELLLFMLDAQYPHAMVLRSGAIVGDTAVEEEAGTPQPAAFSLAQNYPNPFNAGTLISYSVPSERRVILDIFNIHGQRVAAVDQGLRSAGTHAVTWSGTDVQGRPLASGAYFYRLRFPGGEREVEGQRRKMLLLR